MYVWPVLLVWDTTLDDSYRARFQSWWSDSVCLLANRYDLRLEARIIQLSTGSSVKTQRLSVSETILPLLSGNPPRSTLSVSSHEYQDFEKEVMDQRSWLGTGPVVVPTIFRLSSRPIDRPDTYGHLLREVAQRVRDLQVFEYQVNLDRSRDDQWLSEKLIKNHRIKPVVRQNFSPRSGDQLMKFFEFSLKNLDESLRKLRLSSRSGVVVRPVQTISPTVIDSGTQATSPVAKIPDQGSVFPQPTKPWSPSSQKDLDAAADERPTREFRPTQKTPPPSTPVSTSGVEPVVRESTSVEPVDTSAVRAVAVEAQFVPVYAADSTRSEAGPTVKVDDQLAVLKTIKSESVEMKKNSKILSWLKRDPKSPDTDKGSEPSAAPVEEVPKSADFVPGDRETGQEVSLPRAKNGQLIVDTPSTINGKPWFAPKWFKIPVVGPSRDVELEYGGVNSLRLMAASVRGSRHQFYGEPNQDAFAIGKNDQFLVVVVCDGVGSATHSAYGSKFISFSVARSLAKSLESVLPGDVSALRACITNAVQKASDGVQTWSDGALFAPDAPAGEVDRHDLSATLVVGVIEIEPSSQDGRLVMVANVGDSPCYTFVDGDWTLRTAATKDGEVLEHATSALPTEVGRPVVLEWHDFVMKPREQLLLMTDGIGTSLASGRTPLGKWLGERLAAPSLAQDFLSTVDAITFDRQGEDDDRTLVVLYDFDHAFTAPPEPGVEEETEVILSEPRAEVDVPSESPSVKVEVLPSVETSESSSASHNPSTS